MHYYYFFGSQNIKFELDLSRSKATVQIGTEKSVMDLEALQKDLTRFNNYIERTKNDRKKNH